MFYVLWVLGLAVSITLTVLFVSKLENSGFFDKYEKKDKK